MQRFFYCRAGLIDVDVLTGEVLNQHFFTDVVYYPCLENVIDSAPDNSVFMFHVLASGWKMKHDSNDQWLIGALQISFWVKLRFKRFFLSCRHEFKSCLVVNAKRACGPWTVSVGNEGIGKHRILVKIKWIARKLPPRLQKRRLRLMCISCSENNKTLEMVNPPVRRGNTGGLWVVDACGTLKPVDVSPGGTRHHSEMLFLI